MDQSMMDEVEVFISSVEAAQKRYAFREGTVVNYDECRVCYSSDGQLVMQWKGKERSNLQGTKSETLCSFLPFVGVDGTVIMSVYILKGKPNDSEDEILARVVLPNEREGKRVSWPRFYAFTETGYINEEVFEKVMHKFIELWKLQHPGLHVNVFVDQLWSHINVSLIKYGIQNGEWSLSLVLCVQCIPLHAASGFDSKRALQEECSLILWRCSLRELGCECRPPQCPLRSCVQGRKGLLHKSSHQGWFPQDRDLSLGCRQDQGECKGKHPKGRSIPRWMQSTGMQQRP